MKKFPVPSARSRLAFLLATTALPLWPHPVFAQRVETVVVTGSPLSGDPNALATIVGEVSRDEILHSGGANIADALADLPGVTGTGFAGGASRPVIRGFDASRVKIMENGIGSFDVSDIGPDHGVPIDPLSTTRIEVVRGAATLRYGSQAIGGVVNAINNRVPLTLPDAPVSGELTGTYGTGNDAGEGAALVDARAGQFALHADAFDRATGDYDTPDGTQSNSYFRGDGYSFGGSYFFGNDNDSRLGAAIVHFDSNYGVPSDTTHIVMHQTKEMFGSSFAIDMGVLKTLTIDAGYGDYSHDEVAPDGTVADTFKDKEWDSRAETLWGAIGPFSSTALGIQIQHRDFSALGEGLDYLSPTRTATQAGFVFSEMPLATALKLQLGGRVEHVAIKGTPASGAPAALTFTPFSASAGLVFDPSANVTFGLTLASAARAPAVTELFAHGPHDGPDTLETGDPDLKSERANSLEGTVRVHMSDVQIEGALWGASFDRYIYGGLTGRICDDDGVCAFGGPGDLRELFYQQTGAHFWGLEGKATTALYDSKAGTLSGDVLFDYVRATLSGGGNVPRMPPYHVGAGLTWTSNAVDLDARVTYAGPQHALAVAETPTDGFVSIDAGVTWRPDILSGVELSLIGKNLGDSVQRNAVALNKDDVVLPGRDVRLVLHYAF